MQDEYAFFTPGILYSYSRFDKSLVDEFMIETGARVQFVHHFFPFPIFRGLAASSPDDDWNHALFGISREAWEAFRSWCHTVAAIDRLQNQLIRLGVQELEIVDPLRLQKSGILIPGHSTVKIGSICVDSTAGCYVFDPARQDVADLPTVVRWEQRKDTLCFTEALFGGKSPLGGTE